MGCVIWVPVTTVRRVLGMRMGGGVVANILNKQSRTVDKGWSSSLRAGRGTKNS